MNKQNPLQEKSYLFALNTIVLCKHLSDEKEFILSNQLLKSGTSVGANIEEAQHAESRRDFISKLSISLKEAYESRYWLMLLHDSNPKLQKRTHALHSEINQVISLLVKSIKTAKLKLK